MPPKFIGPYRVLETLGCGGVGTVYRALDRRTNDVCALKLLNASPALDARAARRLAREYETLVDLSHPNVVRVFDAGVLQGYPYLAMELIEGLTLRHYLELRGSDGPSPTSAPRVPVFDGDASDSSDGDALEGGSQESGFQESGSEDGERSRFDLSAFNEESPSEDISHAGAHSLRELADQVDEPDTDGSQDSFELPYELPRPQPLLKERPTPKLEELNRPERVGKLKDALLQVCEALAYIHGHGLLHRDLKPSNIMVDEDRQVRLMDFGLAKFVAEDTRITMGGGLVGTFRYMSPEQILGEPMDGRSDLYSLGIILYELLSGRPPFDAQTPDALWTQVLEMEPPPVLSLNVKGDPQLARVTHRLIRKEPDDRFQTAEEVFEALAE